MGMAPFTITHSDSLAKMFASCIHDRSKLNFVFSVHGQVSQECLEQSILFSLNCAIFYIYQALLPLICLKFFMLQYILIRSRTYHWDISSLKHDLVGLRKSTQSKRLSYRPMNHFCLFLFPSEYKQNAFYHLFCHLLLILNKLSE